MDSKDVHDLTPVRSNYENFHNQFDVNSLVQMLEHACTAEALTRVVNVVEATLSALHQYPFEDDEQQRLNVLELEEISDEAKNRYITARRSELRAAAAALDDTAQAWGKKFLDDEFTVVKTKKKSKNIISENLAKKQKIEDITPCHNKFGHLTIEDPPSTSANDMDTSPPSPTRTAQRNSTPPQTNYLQCPRNPASHPPKPKQAPPRQENSWRKRLQMTSAPPQPAPRQTLQLTEEEFPQLPSPPQKTIQTPPTNYQAIKNPLEMLKDPDVQDLYNTLEKFVNIAKNIKSPAERLQALFQLLN
ncbi:hypothetical protein NPIL_430791 [Nephila pilipes]|uniref:Uncharacterized protein n=1 Tax=Nephila pilipes TaxID=299642 RepID=A0A8X6QQM8_NEPPI|nr:hypothetical protein NPIL_430791 [Nephila pilipes]